MCGKVYQRIAAGLWFSPPVRVLKFPPPKTKTDHHDINEKLLKVVFNAITIALNYHC
jgi:hypothetical protein